MPPTRCRRPTDAAADDARCRGERCRRLAVLDLVPLLAWFLNRGRCRHCGAPVSAAVPVLEGIMVAVVLLACLLARDAAEVAAGCVLGWLSIPLAVQDLRHRILPDSLTAALFASGLLAAAALPSGDVAEALVGAAAAGGAFLTLRFAYLRWRRVEALGLGDVKLVAGLGAWLGPAWLPPLVLVAAGGGLSMAVVGAWRAGRGVSATDAVPFGACLGVSALSVWCLKVSAGVLPGP